MTSSGSTSGNQPNPEHNAASDNVSSDKTSGDKITTGNLSGATGVAVGDSAKVEVTHVHNYANSTVPLSPRLLGGGREGVFHINFPRNTRFQGRETELTALHALLTVSGTVGINSVLNHQSAAGVTGMGGIGKTQLAVEYSYRHRTDYPGGIFLINAVEPIQPQLLDVARLLNLTVSDPKRSDINEQLLTALADYLLHHPQTLLIFDNVEDPNLLLRTKFGPMTLPALGGILLITTRTRQLPKQMKSFSLDTLENDPAAAKAIITNARPDLVHDEKLDTLCNRIGYLPLALNLAAAALAGNEKATIKSYLDKLNEWGAERLHAKVNLEDYYARSLRPVLATQWQFLIEMRDKAADARQLFAIAGQLGEAALIPIARMGLFANLQDDPDGWETPLSDAIIQLYNLHLIEIFDSDDSMESASASSGHQVIRSSLQSIRLHPLVRDFAEKCVPAAERPTFRNHCATHVADAYQDLQRVVNEIHTRGIAEIQQDLLTALTLAELYAPFQPTPEGREAHENDSRGREAFQMLHTLNRLLQREAHSLRKESTQTHLAQQLAYRVADRNLDVLKTRAQNLIVNSRQAHFERLWANHSESLALERALRGHEELVMSVAVFDEGRKAISASDDRTLIVWNLETGEQEQRLRGHKNKVMSVDVFDEGRKAISASYDRSLIVWNLQTGEQEQCLLGHENWVMSVAVFDEGRKAISASYDNSLIIWNLQAGEQEQCLRGHKRGVTSVVVFDEGRKAISASYDNSLIIWNLQTGEQEQCLRGHKEWVRAINVFDEGRKAISASDDKTLIVWNLETGKQEQRFFGHEDWVMSVAVFDKGCKAISASSDKTLIVWNLETGEQEQRFFGHDDWVMSVAVFDEGRKAISASDDRMLIVWNLQAIEEEKRFRLHENGVRTITVFSEGRRAISASDDKSLLVWNLENQEQKQRLRSHDDWVMSVVVFDEGRKAVSASADKSLIVWNLKTGEEEHRFFGHENWVRSVAVNDEKLKVISVSDDRTLIIWNLKTGKQEKRLYGHENLVMSVAVFDEGRKAISASADRTLITWNLETGELNQRLYGHENLVMSVAVFDEGRKAISGSYDRSVKVWDLEAGHEIASIVLDGAMLCVAVHEDEHGVIVVAGDIGGGVYCLKYIEPTTADSRK